MVKLIEKPLDGIGFLCQFLDEQNAALDVGKVGRAD
jgi:hypothetical protein